MDCMYLSKVIPMGSPLWGPHIIWFLTAKKQQQTQIKQNEYLPYHKHP